MMDIPVQKNKEFACVIGFHPEYVVFSRQKKERTDEESAKLIKFKKTDQIID